jgi:hypothetical protein
VWDAVLAKLENVVEDATVGGKEHHVFRFVVANTELSLK